jgi:hypothetical protein
MASRLFFAINPFEVLTRLDCDVRLRKENTFTGDLVTVAGRLDVSGYPIGLVLSVDEYEWGANVLWTLQR